MSTAIRSRIMTGVNGLDVRVLEAGGTHRDAPLVLLLHGFPELALSWHGVMERLAAAGLHVVAPDQRGYGRTSAGAAHEFDEGLDQFRLSNLAEDATGLIEALGHSAVDAVVGQDWGSLVAAWCGLTRPDFFKSVVLMSAPFGGPPDEPSGGPGEDPTVNMAGPGGVLEELAALPRPRKHYQWYFSTAEANGDLLDAPQGLRTFLRDYFRFKSADWAGGDPFPLQAWSADELAKLPTYYVMDLDRTMPQTVEDAKPALPDDVTESGWLPDNVLGEVTDEFRRTGFQGALQWYRCDTSGIYDEELGAWSGSKIEPPCCYIAGQKDWGRYQEPGSFEAMANRGCSNFVGSHLIGGAGHWAPQEQPEMVSRLLLGFVNGTS
jgi:pimeloyl-ACP methyl ester carboxylesterase